MSLVEVRNLRDLDSGRLVRVDDIPTAADIQNATQLLETKIEQDVSTSYDAGFAVTQDGSGFPNRTATILSYNNTTRTVSIQAATGASHPWIFHFRGRPVTVNGSRSFTLSSAQRDISGYVSLNSSGNLFWSGAYAEFKNSVLCFYVHYSSVSGQFLIVGDERHSSHRDTQWHESKHIETGMVIRNIGGIIPNIPSNTFQLGNPVVADEDLVHQIQHTPTTSNLIDYKQVLQGSPQIPVLYRTSVLAYYNNAVAPNFHWLTTGLRYNPGTSLSTVPSGYFVNYFLLATNCGIAPIKFVMGKTLYTSQIEASGETINTLGYAFAEMAVLYRITFESGSFGNPGNCRIVEISEVSRSAFTSPAGTSENHNSLIGRSDPDQHPASSIRDSVRDQNVQTSLNGIFTALSGAAIPSGLITMWSGAVANIPAGWVLCDGTNGTPDLRGRFVGGAYGDVGAFSVGTTGGSTSVVTSAAGGHTHNVTVGNTTLTNAQNASHAHWYSVEVTNRSGTNFRTTGQHHPEAGNAVVASRTDVTNFSGSNQAHNHTGAASWEADHTHTLEVIPPYYALAYIMKT